MVTRKLKVKNVEVPFFKYLINSGVSVLFLGRETTRWTIPRTPLRRRKKCRAASGSLRPFPIPRLLRRKYRTGVSCD